jgi:hypothetical protein
MERRRKHALRERENEIQATEMKFLRAIMEKAKRDRIRNSHIRYEPRMEDTQEQMERNMLRWFRHVTRMDEHRIPKRLLEMKMGGKRPSSRQRTRWLDQVKRDTERRKRFWGKVKETQE